MSNLFRYNLNKIITLLLRVAALLYLLFVFYPFITEPGFQNTLSNWLLRWGLIIVLGLAALGFFILKRDDFILYGFFIVFFASIFQFFSTMLNKTPLPEVFLHIYVAFTAIYFATKDLRRTRVSGHHSGKRTSQTK